MKKLLDSNINKVNRILVILPGDIEYRGIQVFFYNIINNMNFDNMSIDIYFGGRCVREGILELLAQNNIGVYIGELDFHKRVSYIQYKKDIYSLIQINKYSCVHVNSGIPRFNVIALDVSKKERINKRIVHSHSSHNWKKSWYKRLYKLFVQMRINHLATNWIACSKEAGDWMFGALIMNKKGIILNNGIDVKKYIFSDEKREKMRIKHNMLKNHVILHVGAFNRAKNQAFLVQIFSEIRKNDKLAKLILIGTGENKEKVKAMVSSMGLEKDVLFIDESNCIENYMQLADLFILPSTFEGLGIVNIEAQAAGLQCLVSDVVPKEAKITNLLEFISLLEQPEFWAKRALVYLEGYERNNTEEEIKKSGYDILDTTNIMQRIYCK